ncbi:MAG TPA: hypothetical protein VF591_20660 [Pyrinomonadaceae bacterium]
MTQLNETKVKTDEVKLFVTPEQLLEENHGHLTRQEVSAIKHRTYKTIAEIASHTIVMVLSLGSIGVIHLALLKLLGADFKFFDLIPIRWLIDVGDITVVARFLLAILLDFRKRS